MAMVSEDMYFGARISSRADLNIITKIMDQLGANNKKRFKESCFGQFVGLQDMQFQGQLYLHLLFKQDKRKARNKIIFHINNREAEFGPNEFALITGLRFGQRSSIAPESKLYKQVFKNKSVLTVQDVELAFLNAKDKGESDLSLKLALLWFLYGVLLVRGHTSKKIEVQYINLADNLEEFNKFPWGRIAFEFFMNEFRAAVENRVPVDGDKGQSKKSDSKVHIDVHGFGFAIQIWAYEAMSCVAKLCATSSGKPRSSIPRMLRWTAKGIIRFDDLTTNCFPILKKGDRTADHMEVKPKLIPSRAELNTTAYLSVVQWEELIQTQNTPSTSMPNKKRKRANIDKGKEGETKKDEMRSNHGVDDSDWREYVRQQFEAIHDKQNHLETMMASILEQLRKSKNVEKAGSIEESDGDGMNAESSRASSPKPQPETEHSDPFATGQELPLVLFEEPVKVIKQKETVVYDPCDAHVPQECVDTFEEWWMSNKDCENTICPSVEVIPSITAQWFNDLWRPDGWLGSEHIDALLHLVMLKAKMLLPTDHVRKSTFVDLNFWSQLTSGLYDNWEKAKKRGESWSWSERAKSIIGHVTGRLPIGGCGIPWSEAASVYGVANASGMHWILFEMRVQERKIVIYDSLHQGRPPARQNLLFRKLAKVLPNICGESKETVWSVERFPKTPQQRNHSDCGVMCIKMFECACFGASIADIDGEMCAKFRKEYCAQLINKDNISSYDA